MLRCLVPSHIHAITANRLRVEGKRGEKQQKIENRDAGPKCQHVSNFSMLFCCLLPFAIIFVCDMFLLFNLIQILICHFFLIYLPCFLLFSCSLSFLFYSLYLSFDIARTLDRGRAHSFIAQLQLQRNPLYKFIHNSNLSKIINIRLKRLTLCFVSLSVYAHFRFSSERLSLGCRTIILPLCSSIFWFNEYTVKKKNIVNSTSYFHNQKL